MRTIGVLETVSSETDEPPSLKTVSPSSTPKKNNNDKAIRPIQPGASASVVGIAEARRESFPTGKAARQFQKAFVLAEGVALPAHVDQHVVDRAAYAADQLRLFVRRRLPVEAAQRAAAGVERQTRLHEAVGQSARGELAGAEGAREGAARVGPRLDVDEMGAGDAERREPHGSSVVSGIATTKRPPHSRTAFICSVISARKFQGRIQT